MHSDRSFVQWRREGFRRLGQTSVLPPSLVRSAIDILMVQHYNDSINVDCEQYANLGV